MAEVFEHVVPDEQKLLFIDSVSSSMPSSEVGIGQPFLAQVLVAYLDVLIRLLLHAMEVAAVAQGHAVVIVEPPHSVTQCPGEDVVSVDDVG